MKTTNLGGERSSFVSALIAASLMTLMACGDDTTSSGGSGGDGGTGGTGAGAAPEGGQGEGGDGGEADGGGGGGGVTTNGGGGIGGEGGSPPPPCATLPTSTSGDVIAVSPDDSVVVSVNRDSESVTVFSVAYDAAGLPTLTNEAELAAPGEPWQVAIDGCGDKAYLIHRKSQKVSVIEDLTGTPTISDFADVGSEPTGLALSPNGSRLYVANWVDGTVSVITVDTGAIESTIDLNAALAGTGLLGPSVTAATARPALAHPRSIAITNDNDNDDDDETVVVTEFFAHRTAPEAPIDANNADVNWVGLLYTIDAGSEAVDTIQLAPDADAGPTGVGCFPNQLLGLTIHNGRAYVPSICASPKGPTGPEQNTFPVVSIVDLAAGAELSASPINLAKEMKEFYTANGTAPLAAQRLPLVANDVAFDAVSGNAYITANGADAVFRAVFDAATGDATEVGMSATKPYLDLDAQTLMAGDRSQNPLGLAAAHSHPIAFVANDVSRTVTPIVTTPGSQEIAGEAAVDVRVAVSAAQPPDPAGQAWLRGKRAFNTGLGRWSLEGRAVAACQACHFEGLSDNITWYFGRGPRQSTSLDGSFASLDPTDQRLFNWTGVFDEIADFESVARGIHGGVGAIVQTLSDPPVNADRITIPGSLADPTADLMEAQSLLQSWNDVEAYVKAIRSPRAPKNLDAVLVTDGADLFAGAGGCFGCHGGAKWTNSKLFYTPSSVTNAGLLTKTYNGVALVAAGFPVGLLPALVPANQVMRSNFDAGDQIQCILRNVGTYGMSPGAINVLELRTNMMTAGQGDPAKDGSMGFNVPSMLGMQVGAPYFHAGNARTLEEALDAIFDGHSKALAEGTFLTGATLEQDRAAMVQFMLSVDESTAVVPLPAAAGADGGSFCAYP